MLDSKLTSWKRQSHKLTPSEAHENRPMYSCGTLLSNSAKRPARINLSDDCCSAGSCHSLAGSSPKDVTDGALNLSACLMCAKEIPLDHLVGVANSFWSTVNEILREKDQASTYGSTKTLLGYIVVALQCDRPVVSEQQRLYLRDTLQSVAHEESINIFEQVVSLLDGLVISSEL